jgi:hypothetical protein
MTSSSNRTYWFRAKRVGWGWGAPSSWQGWVALIAYVALVLAGIPIVQATRGNLAYAGYVVVCTATFAVLCWLRGEPAGRRWNRDHD